MFIIWDHETIDLSFLDAGFYVLKIGDWSVKVVK
jgi:hypothetical protein